MPQSQKGPLYPSAGPLPSSRSLLAVTADEIRKSQYETTAMRATPVRPLSQEIVGENFLNVHAIGQKETRYLPFAVNVAPLTNRLACKYTQDYIPLPLGDKAINKGLAANFKAGNKSGGAAGSAAPMDGFTMSETDYPLRSEAETVDRLRK
ncbi:unnamed protein product, partial [Polarella glacialis]